MEGCDGEATRSNSNGSVPAQPASQDQAPAEVNVALSAAGDRRGLDTDLAAPVPPTTPPGATVSVLSSEVASVAASCQPDLLAAADTEYSTDPLLQDDAECSSDDGSDDVTDTLVKGVFDPDDNLPKPRRFRSKSRPASRSRAGSRLSATTGSNSDVASSGFGSHLSFKRQQPSRQGSTMSRTSNKSGMSRASTKSGVSMLSRASGTSVMSQLSTHESCGFLHISNDIGSMLGSAILLTSPSYLDVYHSSYLNLADQLQLPVDDELALPQDVVVLGSGLTKITEEPEDFDSIDEVELAAGSIKTDSSAAVTAATLQDASRGVLPAKPDAKAVQRACYRRIVSMALTFFFVYSAFFSLRNVQSSLAKDSSLGLLSLGCLYALPWLGACCSYPIMHRIQPKWTMVCATVPYLLFALSNFHAVAYLALPASLVQGFGLGLIWAAEGLYMVNTASMYAIVTGLPLNQAIGKFNSVFYAIYQSSNVVGNGLSSLILQSVFPGEEPPALQPLPSAPSWANVSTSGVTLNVTGDTAGAISEASTAGAASTLQPANVTAITCGIMFDFSQKLSGSPISPAQKYTLLSVMTFMASAGLLVAIFLVKRLDVAHLTGARNVVISFRNMLRIIVDPRMLLLFPVFVYFGFSGSLMFGDYAKAFISCRYGASKIGLVFLVGAAVGVLGSLTSGVIANYTGRAPVILVSGLVASGAYIIMLFWTPPEGGVSFLLFLPVVMWCFSDGILSSQINGFQGFLFQEKLPSACAAYLLCYGCSVALGTMTAAFEWITLQTKTYIVICLQVTALTSYIFIEGLLRRGVLRQG